MKLTIIGPDDPELLDDFLNGKPVSFIGSKDYKVFVDNAYEAYKKQNDPAIKAWHEYTELKKSNFTDGEIRKIAQIILACAMDDGKRKTIDPTTGREVKE